MRAIPRISPLLLLRLAAVFMLLLTATLVLAAPRTESRPSPSDLRIGFDPLSPAEQSRAQEVALKHPAALAHQGQSQRTELLLVETHEEDKAVIASGDWPRRADVYVYNYDTDELLWAVVNLPAGAVEHVETMHNVQLPPTAAESARAVQIALADATAGAVIRDLYRQASGRDLGQPGQLRVQATLFRAADEPEVGVGPAAACGLHRCVYLMLATAEGALLRILPIVDLSASQVVLVNQWEGE
ncbi:MAG: hypothetical protein AB1791_20675 [Chloroflexota bacterium]